MDKKTVRKLVALQEKLVRLKRKTMELIGVIENMQLALEEVLGSEPE